MDLDYVVDSLDKVPAALRECYTEKDGRFHLNTKGEHPKVKEFRDTNILQKRELDELRPLKTKFEGIDPDTARASVTAAARLPAVEQELATEKAARVAAEIKSSESRVRDVLRVKGLAAGALPNALDMLLDKGVAKFTMEGDSIKARPNEFSPNRPGEPLTVEDWLTSAAHEFSFLFAPSRGGGAHGGGRVGTTSNVQELLDPTPQQLGANAKLIKEGKVKVRYTSDGQ